MDERMIPRREALAAGLLALATTRASARPFTQSRNVRSFRLIESAGLRRFGYPVHTLVPDAVEGRNFRLLRDAREIPAQFRTVAGPSGRKDIALDFIASPGPLETGRYEVLFGPDVVPGPEPKGGLKVEKREGRIFVSQGSSLTFEFAENLGGFLRGAGSLRLGYVGDGSGGFSINGSPLKASDVRATVTREGPFAVGLRFEWPGSTLDLTIPHSKSWVQADWRVDDSQGRVDQIAMAMNLLVEGSPTLVDLGAGSTLYGQIKGKERMELEAGRKDSPGWLVRQGSGEHPAVLGASTSESPKPAEGWAHVMDSKRCTALAVADFGRKGRDQISIEADGKLRLTREFIGEAPRSLGFWLHFVPMPVQVGAATSPQSILAPLQVEWDRPSS